MVRESQLKATTMDKKRLEYYKKKLLTRREELMRRIARTQQEGREADEDPTVDLADKAANSYTKEFLFGQTHNDRRFSSWWKTRWRASRTDTFGECVSCHEELQQKRLEAVPWTRYCITCQEKKEKGLLCSGSRTFPRRSFRSLAVPSRLPCHSSGPYPFDSHRHAVTLNDVLGALASVMFPGPCRICGAGAHEREPRARSARSASTASCGSRSPCVPLLRPAVPYPRLCRAGKRAALPALPARNSMPLTARELRRLQDALIEAVLLVKYDEVTRLGDWFAASGRLSCRN